MAAFEGPRGLSETEARRLLVEHGPNLLGDARRIPLWKQLFQIVREPTILLLCVCGGVYLAIGDLEEGLLLCGSVGVVIGITFFQERKTGNAIEALRELSSPRALVVRDGVEKRIASSEVVPGDVVVFFRSQSSGEQLVFPTDDDGELLCIREPNVLAVVSGLGRATGIVAVDGAEYVQ